MVTLDRKSQYDSFHEGIKMAENMQAQLHSPF